jgi:hypothetical protein
MPSPSSPSPDLDAAPYQFDAEKARVRSAIILLQAQHPGPDTPRVSETERLMALDIAALLAYIDEAREENERLRCLFEKGRAANVVWIETEHENDRLRKIEVAARRWAIDARDNRERHDAALRLREALRPTTPEDRGHELLSAPEDRA